MAKRTKQLRMDANGGESKDEGAAGSNVSRSRFLVPSDSINKVMGEFICFGGDNRLHLHDAILSSGKMQLE